MNESILQTTMAGVKRTRSFSVKNDQDVSVNATVTFSFEHLTIDQAINVAMKPAVIEWQATARGKTSAKIAELAKLVHFIEAPKTVVRVVEKPLSEMTKDELQARLTAMTAELNART